MGALVSKCLQCLTGSSGGDASTSGHQTAPYKRQMTHQASATSGGRKAPPKSASNLSGQQRLLGGDSRRSSQRSSTGSYMSTCDANHGPTGVGGRDGPQSPRSILAPPWGASTASLSPSVEQQQMMQQMQGGRPTLWTRPPMPGQPGGPAGGGGGGGGGGAGSAASGSTGPEGGSPYAFLQPPGHDGDESGVQSDGGLRRTISLRLSPKNCDSSTATGASSRRARSGRKGTGRPITDGHNLGREELQR